jgi:hypothetical protein
MTHSDWILIINAVAILFAPVVALWIGGKLQDRSEDYRNKLSLFGSILTLRHDPLSPELAKALNSIDAVFADNPAVREAWTKYYAALQDQNLNVNPGYAIREEKRQQLLLEMIKALGLARKISSAELLRSYTPTFSMDNIYVGLLERIQRKAALEEDLKRRGIPLPPWVGATPAPLNAAPTPQPQQPIATPQSQQPTASGGDGAKATGSAQ